jgi:hypothetical protein
MENTAKENIFISWILWQFYEMPKFLIGVCVNYLVFASNIFSVFLLLKTLFFPWKKYKWNYPKGFNVTEFFNTLISNIFSRFLGALMRLFLIIAGILFQIFVIIATAAIIFIWIALPFIIIAGFIFIIVF